MNQLKNQLRKLVSSDAVRRVAHTAWQAAGGVLISGLLAAHSSAGVKSALVVAGAAALSAIKNALVSKTQ